MLTSPRAMGLPPERQTAAQKLCPKFRAKATEIGLDPDPAQTLWSALIERSIQREIKETGLVILLATLAHQSEGRHRQQVQRIVGLSWVLLIA